MRHKIEAALESLGHATYRHPYLFLFGILLIVALGATQIPKIEIEASTDAFLQSDDPIRMEYDAFLAQFGRDDAMIISVEPPEIFDLGFLEKLRRFHDELEEGVPHLFEVQSLINARETRGEQDELIVGELFEDWPETASELAAIRDRALANPLYPGFLLSLDSTVTALTVELEAFPEIEAGADILMGFGEEDSPRGEANAIRKLTSQEEATAVAAVNEIIARYDDDDFRIHAGGAPIMNSALMTSMVSDIVVFTLLSVLVIALFLSFVFRRAIGVVIPLFVALISVVATVAMMGTLGIPAMPISEIVPSFLLSVGIGGTVHLIVIFQQRLAAGASREDAIAGALAHSGLPIIMTSLTTAGGLASFTAAELMPIVIFGTVAPMGILITLLLTLTLAPALLAVLPLRLHAARSEGTALSIRVLTRMGDFATAHAGRVLAACAALLVIALIGMLELYVSFDSLAWFPDDMPAKVASYKLDDDFGGAMSLEMLIDTGSENGLHDPAVLEAISRGQQTVRGLQVGDVIAGKSVSVVDIVEEIHQALNGGALEARVIPDDRRLISQELLLFENSGSDDLLDVVDSGFRVARFTMRVPMVDGSQYPAFGDEVERIFDEQLGELGDASLTGMMVVMGRSFTASIETLVRSYGIALMVITPLMMLLLGSFRLGLIAMIPNLFPIALTLGLMGWAGVPIELFSLLIGSVALGLAVDDTIHFMHGFRRSYAVTGNVEEAVRETLRTTGQALLFTSIVLSIGFFIYVLSDLSNLQSFGALTAFAIGVAFIADVLLAPALMKVMARFSSIGRPPK